MQPIINIVGSGVVGQATGKGFLARGLSVQFTDIQPAIVTKLREEGLTAHTPAELAIAGDQSDITIFTVSTPTSNGEINLNYLRQAAADLGKRLAKRQVYHLVVVRSTVVPGTTEEVILPIIAKESGKKAGRDFGVCMNPEYLREISAQQDFAKPWLVLIGQLNARSGDILADIYSGFDCPVYRSTIKEAEMQKYVHNIYNAHKISYFNEMRKICEAAGVDADIIFPLVAKSAEGMWNPAYGTKNYGPFDGMCLPKDTQAFLSWANSQGWDMPLLATTIATNRKLLADIAVNMEDRAVVSQPLAIQQSAF